MTTTLKRPRHAMPAFVKRELIRRGLLRAYRERPAYQQNDYLRWISSAKREATQERRLAQMLDELEGGTLYMNMKWRPRRAR